MRPKWRLRNLPIVLNRSDGVLAVARAEDEHSVWEVDKRGAACSEGSAAIKYGIAKTRRPPRRRHELKKRPRGGAS
jgi:hypothetical protein